jgi:hypothetical protein
MGLINCIVNSPVDLETRCNNREMFSNLGVQTCVTYFQDTFLSGELHIQLDVCNQSIYSRFLNARRSNYLIFKGLE